MNLTEFLLARIAEDETEAGAYLDDLTEHPPSVYDMQQVGWIDAGSPERVLAECEAKRRIVEIHTDPGAWCGYDDLTLRFLALPHADHPDYRAEWKP